MLLVCGQRAVGRGCSTGSLITAKADRIEEGVRVIFEGFKLSTVTVSEGAMRVRYGGSGPPLLMLHGNPQTHAMWHAVAPKLARTYTVSARICVAMAGRSSQLSAPITRPIRKPPWRATWPS